MSKISKIQEIPDEQTKELKEEYDLDDEEAERAQELIEEEGIDEDLAVEIAQEGL